MAVPAGKRCRGRARPPFTHGTGFSPHRFHPAVVLLSPPQVTKDSFCHFTSVFSLCCDKPATGNAHTEKMAGSSTELSNAAGLLMVGEASQGRLLSRQPLTTTWFLVASQEEPSPNPRGHRSHRAGTEAFLHHISCNEALGF